MSGSTTKTQNLNSYYTTSINVEKPERIVVEGPENIPDTHVLNKKELDMKWKNLNDDIYENTKKEKKKTEAKVIDYIIGVGATVLGVIGIKYLIKFFRKS